MSRASVGALSALGRSLGVTLAALIHSCWALALAHVDARSVKAFDRHTGTADIVFCTVLSGRDIAVSGVEQMLGLLIATLPLRVQICNDAGTGTLGGLMREVQTAMTAISSHQFCNLAEIAAWAGL